MLSLKLQWYRKPCALIGQSTSCSLPLSPCLFYSKVFKNSTKQPVSSLPSIIVQQPLKSRLPSNNPLSLTHPGKDRGGPLFLASRETQSLGWVYLVEGTRTPPSVTKANTSQESDLYGPSSLYSYTCTLKYAQEDKALLSVFHKHH